MKHGPWALVAGAPAGFVRWRCGACGCVVDFGAEGGASKPTSSTKSPPVDVDDFVGPCPDPPPPTKAVCPTCDREADASTVIKSTTTTTQK